MLFNIKLSAVKKILFYYVAIKLIILLVSGVISSKYFSVPALELNVGNDLCLNDLHYQDNSVIQNEARIKNLILVNSGSLPATNFRLYLANILETIKANEANVIGLDIEFNNDMSIPGSWELLDQLNSPGRIVLAQDKKNDATKIQIKDGNYGQVFFPANQFTIRSYCSSDSSFAYRIAKAFDSSVNKIETDDVDFVLNYKAYDYFPLNLQCLNPIAEYEHSDKVNRTIPMIEAADLLKPDSIQSLKLKQMLKGKIVLVGHIGSGCLDDLKNDLEDKHPVPCDSMLINRQKTMPGVLIHANAVENILNLESRYIVVSDNPLFIAMEEFLLIAYLCFLLFAKAGKVINILLMLALSLPTLYGVLLLMNYSIYIEMGATLLQLLVFEELTEIIEPIYAKFDRISFKLPTRLKKLKSK